MATCRIRRNFHLRDIVKSPPVPPSLMRGQAEALVRNIKARTLSGSDDKGRRFAPLSPAYTKVKARTHPGRPILVRTGEMLADFGVVAATSTRAAIGFLSDRSRRIAGYHQSGTRRMPARPFQRVPEEWARAFRQAIRSQVRRWLNGGTR